MPRRLEQCAARAHLHKISFVTLQRRRVAASPLPEAHLHEMRQRTRGKSKLTRENPEKEINQTKHAPPLSTPRPADTRTCDTRYPSVRRGPERSSSSSSWRCGAVRCRPAWSPRARGVAPQEARGASQLSSPRRGRALLRLVRCAAQCAAQQLLTSPLHDDTSHSDQRNREREND